MKKSVGVLAFFTLLFCFGLSGCDGSISGSKVGTGFFARPDAPTGVSATALSSSAVQVSWYGLSGASFYRVYRSMSSSGTYNRIGDSSYTSYTDSSVSPGTTYYYRVSAVMSTGAEGNQSSAVSATTLLPEPPDDGEDEEEDD